MKAGVVPQTLWHFSEVGHTQDAKKELLDILDFEDSAAVFSTPKPVRLIERILRIATKPGDLVLDFFAGSGTTARTVLNLNAGWRHAALYPGFQQRDNGRRAGQEPLSRRLCRAGAAVMRGYRNKKGEDVAGLGGGFAYLATRLHPRHRLDVRLDHGQVWRAPANAA